MFQLRIMENENRKDSFSIFKMTNFAEKLDAMLHQVQHDRVHSQLIIEKK